MCVNEKLEGAEQPCIATCPTKALRSRSGKAKVILLVLMAFVMLLVAGFLIYAADYSHADETAIKVTVSDNTTTVSMYGHNMVFEPANGEIKAGFIFYPGGKVEYTAYAPLMKRISEQGYLCVLVHMPLNLAVFDKSAAGSVLEQFGKDGPAGKNIEKWYIGGHSLGGAMAASYAAENKDLLEGLVLLAAYPTSDLSNSGLKVLSMYGSEDGVLNAESYSNGRKYMPEGFTEISIDGGNHAGFGNYGAQKGDGAASISAEKQQENAAAAIVSLMN
ncbi:MAG: hypothetical protein HGA22_13545 [Clostridiales bacterium]|nr:hypothetical protein [Clostridiales bacterium]